MKATILLAIALFLATAPEPGPDAIAEMTARFIVLDQAAPLQAAEDPTRPHTDQEIAAAKKTEQAPAQQDSETSEAELRL